MNIFIDESGRFANQHNPKNRNLNCFAVVVMTDSALSQWNEKYSNLDQIYIGCTENLDKRLSNHR